MYLLVTSVSIGKIPVLKTCETNIVWVEFGHVCSQKTARDLLVSAEECCSDVHTIILPKNYSVTGALTYICIVVIFTIIGIHNALLWFSPLFANVMYWSLLFLATLVTECESHVCTLLYLCVVDKIFFLHKIL